jgi:CheY-like chemotaxis protein
MGGEAHADGVDVRMNKTGERQATIYSVKPDPEEVTSGCVVLLVDDNHAAVTLTAATLRRLGCRTLLAANGEKALQILENQSSVDVVVTDVDMPRLNGIELLRRIKKSGKHKDLPVILFSGRADPDTVKAAAEHGCVLYLSKPVEPDVLFEHLTTLLKRLT